MKVRRAALLVIGGAIMLPSMLALAVFMCLHSGARYTINPAGPDYWTYSANPWLMGMAYIALAFLCALWGYAVAFGTGDAE